MAHFDADTTANRRRCRQNTATENVEHLPCQTQKTHLLQQTLFGDDGIRINLLHIIQIFQRIKQLLHLDCIVADEVGFSR